MGHSCHRLWQGHREGFWLGELLLTTWLTGWGKVKGCIHTSSLNGVRKQFWELEPDHLCCEKARACHCYGLAWMVCLLNLPWTWSGEEQGTRALPQKWFECGYPTLQCRPRLLSEIWNYSECMWCAVTGMVWGALPPKLYVGISELGSSPCAAYSRAWNIQEQGLGHPGAELRPSRSRAQSIQEQGLGHPEVESLEQQSFLRAHRRIFGCACCQDNVATLTHKVQILPLCLFTELFTLPCLPQQSSSPFWASGLVPI